MSPGENANLAHLSERDAELLEERILIASKGFHQLSGALVVEQRLVRGEEAQIRLQVLEVLVVESGRGYRVVEKLWVVVVVG